MSIIDENEVDVVAIQKETDKLRKENQSLLQENARLKAEMTLAKIWSQDIDNLYHMIYGEENEHTKMLKMIGVFSTKKGKLLLKFLT